MNTPFTAALLTGASYSKALTTIDCKDCEGVPLWQRQVRLLEKLNPERILITGNPDGPYSAAGHEIIPAQENKTGLLPVLNDLLSICSSPRLLVLGINLPWMTAEALEKLLAFEDGVVPEYLNVPLGTAAVYPLDILPLIRNTLQSPNRSIDSFIHLALNNGFIDTWPVPPELEKCFQSCDASADDSK